MYSECIGILGLGSYATAHFFKRLLDAFPGEKEWDRPQIIINNDCTIPSRVRAILYGENVERVKREMVECAAGILRCAGEKKVKIVIACNTAHHYINYLQRELPEAEFMNIIEICASRLANFGVKKVTVLASEGVMDARIYDPYLQEKGIDVEYPLHLMKDIRFLIESVKQNIITDEAVAKMQFMLEGAKEETVVLGCTELPVIYERLLNRDFLKHGERIFDPLTCVIEKLKREMK